MSKYRVGQWSAMPLNNIAAYLRSMKDYMATDAAIELDKIARDYTALQSRLAECERAKDDHFMNSCLRANIEVIATENDTLRAQLAALREVVAEKAPCDKRCASSRCAHCGTRHLQAASDEGHQYKAQACDCWKRDALGRTAS